MKNAFELREVTKQYGNRQVLNIKSLNIQNGCITSLIGPSGAGKSTLLNLLACIEQPTDGTICCNGMEYPKSGRLDLKRRRELAIVYQKPVMFNRSIRENIAYGVKLRGISKEQIRRDVEAMASRIGLLDKLEQNARSLSGGEMQRVAMARAMILKPKILLLDEATANLDPANVAVIEELIRFASHQMSVVMVTHNIHQARRLSSQCVFLLNGSVIEQGTAREVLEQPKDSKTKAFLNGEMVC